jgi:hypothetical protein
MGPGGPFAFALYVQEHHRLLQPAFVEDLLQRLVVRGYQWVDFWEVLGERGGYVPDGPALSSQALQSIQAYLQGEPSAGNRQHHSADQTELSLKARRENDIFQEFYLRLFPDQGMIELRTDDDDLFVGPDTAEASYELFLDIIKDLALGTGAYYGSMVDYSDEETPQAILHTRRPKNISMINFWGPEIVAELGKERILALPAWRNELLSNGGVLLIPDDSFGRHRPFAFKKIQVALGFPTPDPELEWCEDVYDNPAEWQAYLATQNKEL